MSWAKGLADSYKMGFMVLGLVVFVLVGFVFVMRMPPTLTHEENVEVNFLDNTIFDLEHPTDENARVRVIECENRSVNSAKWLKIHGTKDKVERYLKACENPQR